MPGELSVEEPLISVPPWLRGLPPADFAGNRTAEFVQWAGDIGLARNVPTINCLLVGSQLPDSWLAHRNLGRTDIHDDRAFASQLSPKS